MPHSSPLLMAFTVNCRSTSLSAESVRAQGLDSRHAMPTRSQETRSIVAFSHAWPRAPRAGFQRPDPTNDASWARRTSGRPIVRTRSNRASGPLGQQRCGTGLEPCLRRTVCPPRGCGLRPGRQGVSEMSNVLSPSFTRVVNPLLPKSWYFAGISTADCGAAPLPPPIGSGGAGGETATLNSPGKKRQMVAAVRLQFGARSPSIVADQQDRAGRNRSAVQRDLARDGRGTAIALGAASDNEHRQHQRSQPGAHRAAPLGRTQNHGRFSARWLSY